MLFAIYIYVEPVLANDESITIESISSKKIHICSQLILGKIDLVHSTANKIRERIFLMPQLIFLKRDLTGTMGLLRHFPVDMVNTMLDELTKYEFIRQGREH